MGDVPIELPTKNKNILERMMEGPQATQGPPPPPPAVPTMVPPGRGLEATSSPGMHWKWGRYPHPPLQGAQPMPSLCLPGGKCQLQWHL